MILQWIKKNIGIKLISRCYTLVFAICLLPMNLLAQSLNDLPNVRVIMEYSPPHQDFDGTKVSGVIPALLQEKLSQAGFEPVFEIFPWSRAMDIARNEPNVLISNIARSPERETQFHWIGKVHRYRLGLISLDTRQDIVLYRVEDAKHYTIAVQRNDIAQDVLIKKGFEVGINIFLTASIAESWQLLSRGKVDFVIDDEDNIQAMESKYLLIDQKARSVIDISELSLDTWLAANIQSNPALINSIKRHF